MKGRRLTIDEVKELRYGTKLWVESKYYVNEGEIMTLYSDIDLGIILEDDDYEFYTENQFDELEIFEYIESYSEEVIQALAYEVAKLRHPNYYEYPDKLIRQIIEEFL